MSSRADASFRIRRRPLLRLQSIDHRLRSGSAIRPSRPPVSLRAAPRVRPQRSGRLLPLSHQVKALVAGWPHGRREPGCLGRHAYLNSHPATDQVGTASARRRLAFSRSTLVAQDRLTSTSRSRAGDGRASRGGAGYPDMAPCVFLSLGTAHPANGRLRIAPSQLAPPWQHRQVCEGIVNPHQRRNDPHDDQVALRVRATNSAQQRLRQSPARQGGPGPPTLRLRAPLSLSNYRCGDTHCTNAALSSGWRSSPSCSQKRSIGYSTLVGLGTTWTTAGSVFGAPTTRPNPARSRPPPWLAHQPGALVPCRRSSGSSCRDASLPGAHHACHAVRSPVIRLGDPFAGRTEVQDYRKLRNPDDGGIAGCPLQCRRAYRQHDGAAPMIQGTARLRRYTPSTTLARHRRASSHTTTESRLCGARSLLRVRAVASASRRVRHEVSKVISLDPPLPVTTVR